MKTEVTKIMVIHRSQMKWFTGGLFLLLLTVLAHSNPDRFQILSPMGAIYGKVLLMDGSGIPGVEITLTNNRGEETVTITSEKGTFQFLSVPAGIYTIRCVLEGFSTYTNSSIIVGPERSVNLHFLLESPLDNPSFDIGLSAAPGWNAYQ